MRVRFVLGAYPPSTGGAQLHTQALARALPALGVTPRVTTLWRESRTDYLLGTTVRLGVGTSLHDDDGIVVEQVGLRARRRVDAVVAAAYLPLRGLGSRYFAAALDLPPADADVVHVVRLGREHLAVAAFRDARTRGIPVVLTPNHHPRWSGRRPDPVWRRLYRSADAVVALTHAEASMLVALGVSRERITVTGIGPVLGPPGDVSALDLPAGYLLFLGQQLGYKRLDVALDALRLLPADVHLVLAGPEAPDTAAAVSRRGLQHRVRRLGVVDEPTKAALLRDAAAVVFPSEQEAFGGVLVEAAASGVPFVARGLPQLQEVRDALDWGRTFEGGAPELARCVEGVLASAPDAAARAGAEARAADRFAWPALARRYADLYEQLAGRG